MSVCDTNHGEEPALVKPIMMELNGLLCTFGARRHFQKAKGF